MKSLARWILSVILGAGMGYGAHFFVEMNLYLLIGIGIIVGSSIGVTWNVHREKYEEFEGIEIEEDLNIEETDEKKNPNQTSS